jgi:hypothetical protein
MANTNEEANVEVSVSEYLARIAPDPVIFGMAEKYMMDNNIFAYNIDGKTGCITYISKMASDSEKNKLFSISGQILRINVPYTRGIIKYYITYINANNIVVPKIPSLVDYDLAIVAVPTFIERIGKDSPCYLIYDLGNNVVASDMHIDLDIGSDKETDILMIERVGF